MALGEPIGYSARLTMNNSGLYQNQVNQFARGVHVALMGDPTLRAHQVAPPSNLTGGGGAGNVRLTWSGSSEGAAGYHIYRAGSMGGNFGRLNGSLVNGTAFTDSSAASGATYVYMVRAVKMQNTPSGSYLNASQGAFETVTVGGGGEPPPPPPPPPPPDGDPNPPTIAMQAPAHNATISGSTVMLKAAASDDVDLAGVQFRVDGVDVGPELWVPPFEMTWNTASYVGGEHRITALARDAAGNRTVANAVIVNLSKSTSYADVVWMEDSLPTGAQGYTLRDRWKWQGAVKYSGTLAHSSIHTNGLHQHYFDNATATLNVGTGDILYVMVYLDPKRMPREIMLQWSDGSWEHRAYWGENIIGYGTPGTSSRRYMGPIPASGRWVRLKVPAAQVGLEGRQIKGMAFTLQSGIAFWDRAGKLTPK